MSAEGRRSPSPVKANSPLNTSSVGSVGSFFSSAGKSTGSPGRSKTSSPGRYVGGDHGFNSSGPRSVLLRTNMNSSCVYDYDLCDSVDTNSASYRYHRHVKSPTLTATHVPAQDTLIHRAQSPPVGTYNVSIIPCVFLCFLTLMFSY